MSLSEGQVLDGKYVITRRIAEGGMSTVFLGVNQRIGKDVAVKVLHAVVARDADVVERFEREARIVSRIKSAHIADVFDFGELPTGERFMVMEYLEGESLATRLERERTLAPRAIATVTTQILAALTAAHSAGVIHRDLKPENVIVTTRGKETLVKVVDFGVSKILGADDPKAHKLTAANSVLGTPLYMSPEQARGQTSAIDQRTDLYSLGVILYEAVAGEPPLTGENVNDLLFRVALDEPVPLDQRVPNVDPALARIVQRAMAKDPAARYQSADEMAEDIGAWAAMFTSGPLSPVLVGDAARASAPSIPTPSVPPDAAPGGMTPSGMTPMVLTVPSPPAPDRLAPLRARRSRATLAVPLLALALLVAPFVWRGTGHPAPASSVAVAVDAPVVPPPEAKAQGAPPPPAAEEPSAPTPPAALVTPAVAEPPPAAAHIVSPPPAARRAPLSAAPRSPSRKAPEPTRETKDAGASATLVSGVALSAGDAQPTPLGAALEPPADPPPPSPDVPAPGPR